MKVLILSIKKNQGSDDPAEILKEYLNGSGRAYTAEIEDIFRYTGPMIDTLVLERQLNTVSKAFMNFRGPETNHHIYGNTEDKAGMALENMINSKLGHIIDSFSPDVLVCMHPYYLELLNPIKRSYCPDIPVIALITDYSLIYSWAQRYVDAYVTADDGMKSELVYMGVDEDKIFPYGIPISPRYFLNYDRQTSLEALGLQDRPTILLIGMNPCTSSNKEILKLLISLPEDFQIIVAAGYNQKFKNQAAYISQSCKKSIRIFGSIDMLPEIMASSNIMITPPSYQIISKAMAIGLPFAFISPIQGIHSKAAENYLKRGLGIEIRKDIPGMMKVIALLNDNLRLKVMKSAYKTVVKPDSISHIAGLISEYHDKTADERKKQGGSY